MKKIFQILKAIIKSFLIWFALMVVFIVIDNATGASKKNDWITVFFVLIPIVCAVWNPCKKLILWAWSVSKSKAKPKVPKSTYTPARRQPVKPVPAKPKPAPQSTSLARIDKMEGHEFERFTADLLRKLGYERVEVTPGSGDQGVDVIAVKDGKRYAIQCKRYSQKLGNKPVQEVFAGKTIYGCSVAVVLTNNYFTDGAKEAAKATGVELWDRDTLRRMLDYANYKAIV